MTDGEVWRQQRRFVLRNLRDSGIGKQTLEPLILNEIQHFLAEVKKFDDKGPCKLYSLLFNSMTNNIHILTTGTRYDYGHPAIKYLHKLTHEFDELSQGLPAETFFPWLKPILHKLNSKSIKLNKLKELFIQIIEDVINETKSKNDSQSENFIQAYVNEMKNNPTSTIFNERGLLHTTRDLIGAGTETSSSTLDWAGLYMASYPEIQKKVQDEIDRVIGQREPSYNDRVNTPYTEATICELHRIISLVPLSVPHRVMKDTILYGYNIPKDTMVLPNIWAVHYDKDLWGDPENFRPERFIGPNGDCVKPEYLIPFSTGKRACAGEPLARMELYLYFVSLLQNFAFSPPKGEKISLEAPPGFARKPLRNKICIKSRH
ncbi:Cytochrome P450 2 sub R member 1, variant 2 [Chamberlinius hualienensis]